MLLPNFDSQTTLILIDVQNGFSDAQFWGTRNNSEFEDNVGALLKAWRAVGLPVIHVQHMSIHEYSPLRPGQSGNEFCDYAKPLKDEPVVQKNVNSGFIGTDLEKILRSAGIETVVLAGLTTDHCVSTTTRMAANLGFTAVVAADATATFNRKTFDGKEFSADQIYETALASLHDEFAAVASTKCVIDNLPIG